MKNIILLVFTQPDVEALGKAAAMIRGSGCERLWIIHNPTIGVSENDALKAFDRDIHDLDEAVTQASARRDFAAAADYQERLTRRKVDRDLARREGFKQIPPDELDRIHDRVLAPLVNPPVARNVQITPLSEAHDESMVGEVLVMVKQLWPKELKAGEFAVIWPRAINEPAAVKVAVPVAEKWVEPAKPKTRHEEIRAKRFFGIQRMAKDLGVWTEGMKTEDAINAIVEFEKTQPAKAA